jgi:hypothetical protein
VLLSNDRGVERTGKWVPKEASQVFIQELNESELSDEVSKSLNNFELFNENFKHSIACICFYHQSLKRTDI